MKIKKNMAIGTRIKQLRLSKNLSQKQLAKILHTTNSSICDWECGRTLPKITYLIAIANFFNVTADFLLGIN